VKAEAPALSGASGDVAHARSKILCTEACKIRSRRGPSRRNRLLRIEKDELLKKIWPDSFVEEGNLASHISTLRKGENSEDRKYSIRLSRM
jgi:hypothetical protein